MPVFRSFSTSEQGQGTAASFWFSHLVFLASLEFPLMPGSQNSVFRLNWKGVSGEESIMDIYFNIQLVLLKDKLSNWIVFF